MSPNSEHVESKLPTPGVESDSVPGGVDPASMFQPKNTPPENINNTNLRDAVEAVFNTGDMTVKSVLDTKHIIALAKGRIFGDRYSNNIILMLCDELLQMRVSLKGRGRKDLATVLQSAMRAEIVHDDEQTKAKKLFGSG